MERLTLVVLIAVLAACAPKRVNEEPILENGDRVPDADATVATIHNQAVVDQAERMDARDQIAAEALASCTPEVCAAITRGELALGMNETQVMAATRTTPEAWSVRRAGNAVVMVPVSRSNAPRDGMGEIAMVQLRDGQVSTYSYLEAGGVRVVDDPDDATTSGRAAAMADMLIREGDDLAARGDLDGALDRYDRASVLRADPMIDYRIATVLDKQLRPIEALIRYRLFLHRLELEKIDAVGDAYAKLAEAIAHARERVIILENRGR
ncbi:MAG TPA: hypothetical protein VF158_04995 [Longimicrobiales bacterium]